MPSPGSFTTVHDFEFPPPPADFSDTTNDYLEILPDTKKTVSDCFL